MKQKSHPQRILSEPNNELKRNIIAECLKPREKRSPDCIYE